MKFPKYQDTGRFRGYGHIKFSKHEEAEKAIKLSGNYLK